MEETLHHLTTAINHTDSPWLHLDAELTPAGRVVAIATVLQPLEAVAPDGLPAALRATVSTLFSELAKHVRAATQNSLASAGDV